MGLERSKETVEAGPVVAGVLGTAGWAAFYNGWLAGYKASGADPNEMPPSSSAQAAYKQYLASKS